MNDPFSTVFGRHSIQATTPDELEFTRKIRKKAEISRASRWVRSIFSRGFSVLDPTESGREKMQKYLGDPLEHAAEFETQAHQIKKRKPRLDEIINRLDAATLSAEKRERTERLISPQRNQTAWTVEQFARLKKEKVTNRIEKIKIELARVRDEGLTPAGFWRGVELEKEKAQRQLGNLADFTADLDVLNEAVRKFGTGEELTPEETEVWAKQQLQDITRLERENFKHQVGTTLAGSMRFLAEFALAFYGAKTATRGTKITQYLMKPGIKPMIAKSITAGVVIPAAMPTRVIPEMIERQKPVISYDIVSGKTEIAPGKDPHEAFLRAYGDTAVEVWSEMMGGAITHVGKKIRRLFPQKATAEMTDQIFSATGTGKNLKQVLRDVSKMAQFQGIVPEILEEELGAPLSALINEENYNLPTSPEGFQRVLMSAVVAGLFQAGGITLIQAENLSRKYKIKFDKNKLGALGGMEIKKIPEVAPEVSPKEKKVCKHCLDEAQKHPDFSVQKGVFVAGAKNKAEAVKTAISLYQNPLVTERLGRNTHAWNEKDGEIYDFHQAEGKVENAFQYVSESEIKKEITPFEKLKESEQVFKEYSGKFSLAVGKKITPERLKIDFARSKMSFEEFTALMKTRLKEAEKKAREIPAGELRDELVQFSPMLDEQLDEFAKNPKEFVEAAGLTVKNIKEARDAVLEGDSGIFQGQLEHITKEVEMMELGSHEEVYEALVARIEVLMDKKPKKVERARIKRTPKNATQKVIERIKAENKQILAEFRERKLKEQIEVLRERPTETRFIQTKLSEYRKGYRKGKIETQKEGQILRTEIAAFARKHIPRAELRKSEVSKVITSVVKTKTPEAAQKAFNYILEVAEKTHKRILTKKIDRLLARTKTKIVGGKLTGKLVPESQTFFEKIRKFGEDSGGEIQEKREKTFLKLETDPDNLELLLESEALQHSGRKEMPAVQLMRTFQHLKARLAEGRWLRKEQVEKRINKKDSAKIPILAGFMPHKPESAGMKKIDELVFVGLESFVSKADSFSRYDHASKPLESALSTLAYFAQDAQIETNAIKVEFDAKLNKIVSEVTGLNRAELRDQIAEWKEIKEIADGVQGSDFDAISFYLQWRQEQRQDWMLTHGAVINEIEYKITEEIADQIIENVPADLVKIFDGKVREQIIQPIGKMLVAPMEEKTGVTFPLTPEYWMSMSKRDLVTEAHNEQRNFLNMTAGVPTATKARSKIPAPVIILNPFIQTFKYVDEASQFLGHYEFNKLGSSLFADHEFSQASRNNFGDKMAKDFERSFRHVIAGKVPRSDGEALRVLEKASNYILDRVVLVQLGMKPALALKQWTSIAAPMFKNPTNFFADLTYFLANRKKVVQELRENSPWFDQRIKRKQFEMDIDIEPRDLARKILQEQTLGQKGMVFIRSGDIFAVAGSGWHIYKQHQRDNPNASKKEAGRRFGQISSGVQQESAMYSRNELQKIKILRFSRMYKTTPFQYMQKFLENFRALVYGRGTMTRSKEYWDHFNAGLKSNNVTRADVEKMQELSEVAPVAVSKKQIARAQALYWFQMFMYHSLLNMFYQWVGDAFQFKVWKQLRAAVLGNFNAIPLAGEMIVSLWGSFFKEDFGRSDPLGEAVWSVKDAVISAKKIVKKIYAGDEVTEKDFKRTAKEFATFGGLAVKLPFPGVYNFAAGVYDLIKGHTKDPRRLLFSEYSIGKKKDPFLAKFEKLNFRGKNPISDVYKKKSTPSILRVFGD